MLLLGALVFLLSGSARALNLPVFDDKPVPVVLSAKRVDRFRVLIFPHWGDYSIPQGSEPSAASVKVSSEAACDVYQATVDHDDNWKPRGEKIDSAKEFTISAKQSKHQPHARYYACSAPFTVHRPAPLTSIEYSGDFVALLRPGKVSIINVVDPETYLKGVIPSEVPKSWPAEVLKAQAVAARTYAWWSVKAARAEPATDYDLDDTVFSQAYLGNRNRSTETDLAAADTARQVLTFQGEPIKAYFSDDNGGYTETAREAFGIDLPYCQSKPEKYDLERMSKPTGWTKDFTAAQLQELFDKGTASQRGTVPKGLKIVGLTVTDRDESGRARTLAVTATNGKKYSMTASQFRYLTHARSTLFSIAKTGSTFQLTGKGYGHGVGMAQQGAYEYVTQLHWSYDQILKFYYDGAMLEAP